MVLRHIAGKRLISLKNNGLAGISLDLTVTFGRQAAGGGRDAPSLSDAPMRRHSGSTMKQSKKPVLGLLAIVALSAPMVASSAAITLTFEGVGDLNAVGEFYNGGGGPNYGVSFSPDAIALVDADAGGSGNFANEPSPSTVMFFLEAEDPLLLSMAAGFTREFSFSYSALEEGRIQVYDGLGATGNLLASRILEPQFNTDCAGDPQGQYCNWTAVTVNFAGTARSISLGGTVNLIGFDDITLGSDGPDIVPEPGSLALVGLGLVGLGMARRRKPR